MVIRGLFGIALGIFIIARPFDSVAVLALVIAIWALADRIVNIVHAWGWTLTFSSIAAVIGRTPHRECHGFVTALDTSGRR